MQEIKEFMRELCEGRLPDGVGMRLTGKAGSDPEDNDIYLDLPLDKDTLVYVMRWGAGRKAAALYGKEDFEEIEKAFHELADYGTAGRRLSRMFLCYAFCTEYEEGLGFPFPRILLDGNVGQWEYIGAEYSKPQDDTASSTKGVRPYAFLRAADTDIGSAAP